MEELGVISQQLIDAIVLQDKLTFEGKFRLAERQADIIGDIIEKIKLGQVDKTILEQLCSHSNMNVRHVASMTMLRMNYRIERALEALASVANSNENIIRLVADWQIKSWKEFGAIDPPSKEKELKRSKNKNRTGTLPTFEPAIAKYEELNEKQRVAYLASLYDGEINNGGHYQYFENQGVEHIQETINSLKIIGARKQSIILDGAYKEYLSKKRHHPATVEAFVEEERKGEFTKFDKAFYNAKTEIHELVDEYLEKNNL